MLLAPFLRRWNYTRHHEQVRARRTMPTPTALSTAWRSLANRQCSAWHARPPSCAKHVRRLLSGWVQAGLTRTLGMPHIYYMNMYYIYIYIYIIYIYYPANHPANHW